MRALLLDKKSLRSDASAESIVWSDRSVTLTKEDSAANVKYYKKIVRVQASDVTFDTEASNLV